MAYGAALEKRSPHLVERGFESHPLRHDTKEHNLTFSHTVERCWSGLSGAPGERV